MRDIHPPEVVEAARRLQARLQNTTKIERPVLDQKIIKAFVSEAEKAVTVLKKLIETDFKRGDDYQNYIIKVHSMKSGLANVNEKEMSDFAYKLEKAGQDRALDIILNETPAFINALNSLIVKYKPEKPDEDALPLDDLEISAEDTVYLREKMTEIKNACEMFKISDAKAALEALNQKTWPRRINNTLEEISVHLLHSALKVTSVIAENTINFYKN